MRFNTVIDGHPATIMLPDGQGDFVGSIQAPDFGNGSIVGKRVGDSFVGSASLANHTADFRAVLAGNVISGVLSLGWFWKKSFSGTIVA